MVRGLVGIPFGSDARDTESSNRLDNILMPKYRGAGRIQSLSTRLNGSLNKQTLDNTIAPAFADKSEGLSRGAGAARISWYAGTPVRQYANTPVRHSKEILGSEPRANTFKGNSRK